MPSQFLPGDQITREQMALYAQQIAGGRPAFGSVGNYFNGQGGTINPAQLPDWLRSQLEYTNVDDNGNGAWNFGTGGAGGYTTRDGRQGYTQLGDTNGQWDHRYIKDWSLVEYDPEMGLQTPWSNIQHQEDKSMTNFLNATRALIAAGAGAGISSMYGGTSGFVPSDYGMAADYAGLSGLGEAGTAGATSLFPNDPYAPYYNGSGTVDAGVFPGGINDPYAPYYGSTGTVDAGVFPGGINDPYSPFYDANGFTDAGGVTPGTGIQTGTPPPPAGSNGLLDSLRNGAGSLLGSTNPLQILGLLQGASGLFNNGGSKPPSSSGDSAKGGGGIPQTPYQRTPYTPNQVTQQQLRDFRPVGS